MFIQYHVVLDVGLKLNKVCSPCWGMTGLFIERAIPSSWTLLDLCHWSEVENMWGKKLFCSSFLAISLSSFCAILAICVQAEFPILLPDMICDMMNQNETYLMNLRFQSFSLYDGVFALNQGCYDFFVNQFLLLCCVHFVRNRIFLGLERATFFNWCEIDISYAMYC